MAGWFELHKSANGQYFFNLKAANGERILKSEQYESKPSAQNGIGSVQANCPLDARYDKKESKDSKYYFNLKAINGQVIGTSETYSSTQSRDGGIASVKTNGTTTTIKDLT